MSGQVADVLREKTSYFAGSDIFAGAPVAIASPGADSLGNGWTVIQATSSAQKPIGIARDNAGAGFAVTVEEPGNIVHAFPGAGASWTTPSYVGVVGSSQATHPVSGVVGSYPVLGPVTPAAGVAVGASGAPVWALGFAVEPAAPGDQAHFRIEPRLLSGLVTA